MTSKKNDNWIVYLIIGIVLVFLFLHFYKSSPPDDEQTDKEAERLRRIKELENEKQLLIDDRNNVINLEKKLNEQSQKLWKKIIRILIGIFVFLNLMGYLIFKSFSIESVLTWYGIVLLIINLPYLFFAFKLVSMKEFLFEHLKEFSYKIVAGNKNASYFLNKLETVQNRIDQIDFELNQLYKKEL